MFSHWSKRTKVLMGVFAGVLAVGIGVGAWGISTGRLASMAAVPYQGKIKGSVTCESQCTRPAGVELWTMGGQRIGYYQFDSQGTWPNFSFDGLIGGQYYKLAIGKTACISVWGRGSYYLGYCKTEAKNVMASYRPTSVTLSHQQKTGVLDVTVFGRRSGGSAYPLVDATVRLSTGAREKTTKHYSETAAHARFSDVPKGSISITVTKTGYAQGTISKSILACAENSASVTLLEQ